MRLIESIIHKLGGATQRDVQAQIQEALANFPALTGIDPDDDKWRRITNQPTRELDPLAQDRMINLAAFLYEMNPTAGRMAELTRDFVVGEGIKVEGLHPKVDEIIKRHWEDPANEWELKLDQKVLELGLYGEQIWPAFVSDNAGRVRLGYIDPAMIDQVVPDPENVEMLIGIQLKSHGGRPGKRYRIVLDAEEASILSPAGRGMRNQFNDGQTFYFTVNRLSNSTRGRSDFLSLIDWLFGYEDVLYTAMERTNDLQSYLWDVTLTGMTEEKIREYAKKQKAPRPGSTRYHNEQVKWDAVAPELKAVEIARHVRTFLAHIAARRGFPVHWLSTADDVNVATAKEMGIPTLKTLSNRQKVVVAILKKVVRFVIRRAVDAEILAKEVDILDSEGKPTGEKQPSDQAFHVTAPELSVRDMSALSTAFQQLVTAVVLAINAGILTRETATRMLATAAGMMGMEIDAKTEIEKAIEEKRTGPDYSPEAIRRAREEYSRAAS